MTHDEIDGIRMLGGEMLTWSDRPNAVSGTLALALCPPVPDGGRALLAGPHSPGLARVLAGRLAESAGRLDVLVRSWPDAQLLRDELADLPVRVLCGTLARLDETAAYDVVVALDGLDRLEGADLPPLGWAGCLEALVRRQTGGLLLGLPSPLRAPRVADTAWPTPEPATPDGLPDVLEALDRLDALAATWAVVGPYAEPVALATESELHDRRHDDRLIALAPTATDQAAIRAGAGFVLAPGWVLVTRIGPDRLPELLLAEPGPVRAIDVVAEQQLFRALARGDEAAARALVREWSAGVRAGSGDAADQVLAAGLLEFTRRLVAGGHRHPWPTGTTSGRIAAMLAPSADLDPAAIAGTAADEPDPAVALPDVAALLVELEDRESQVEWLIGRIHRREVALRQRKLALARLRESPEYRLGSRLLRLRGSGRKKARDAADDGPSAHEWQPKDAVEKAPLNPKLLPPSYRGSGAGPRTAFGTEGEIED